MVAFLTFLFVAVVVIVFKPYEGKNFKTTFKDDKVKVCITGDTGMNTTLQREMAEMLRAENCDRIIIVGDLIYPDGIKSSDDPQIKQKFDDYYHSLTTLDKKPKVALINGNHDYRGNFSAWLEAAQKRDWVIMPSRYYMEDIGGFCFYYLDSNIFLRSAYRWDIIPQIRWFLDVREQNFKTCHTEVVFTHHPYLSEGNHGNAEGFLKWVYDWLVIDRADFLISGHAHLTKDFGKIGKTHLLISGAGGAIEKGYKGGLLILELGLNEHSISYHFNNHKKIGIN